MISDRNYAVRRTQQYLIDLLNSTFFSGKVHWDALDLFNSLPVIFSDTDTEGSSYLRREIRAGLLVHKQFYYGCKLSICAETGLTDRVCYRLSPLNSPIRLEDANRIVFPMSNKFDISLSDLNLGADDISSYCYYNSIVEKEERSLKSSVFHVLKFILDSDIVVSSLPGIFDELPYEATTHVPSIGDLHNLPVFEVTRKDNGI